MLKKSFAFGLLAAGLMIAPGAALADNVQSQNSNQQTVQDGLAEHGSTNAQSSETLNVQKQISEARKRVGGGHIKGRFGHRRPRPVFCGTKFNGQSQNSSQGTLQSGRAFDGSVNGQSNSGVSDQTQISATSHACR